MIVAYEVLLRIIIACYFKENTYMQKPDLGVLGSVNIPDNRRRNWHGKKQKTNWIAPANAG